MVLTMITLEGAAQSHSVGIVGGAARTNVTSSNFISPTVAQYNWRGGITYEYFLARRLSLGADLTYTRTGFASGYMSPVDKTRTYYHYDYLSVPLKIGWNDFDTENIVFGLTKAGFIKVGLVPAWLVNAETETPAVAVEDVAIPARTSDVTSRVSSFDLAGIAEVGSERTGDRCALVDCIGNVSTQHHFSYQRRIL